MKYNWEPVLFLAPPRPYRSRVECTRLNFVLVLYLSVYEYFDSSYYPYNVIFHLKLEKKKKNRLCNGFYSKLQEAINSSHSMPIDCSRHFWTFPFDRLLSIKLQHSKKCRPCGSLRLRVYLESVLVHVLIVRPRIHNSVSAMRILQKYVRFASLKPKNFSFFFF